MDCREANGNGPNDKNKTTHNVNQNEDESYSIKKDNFDDQILEVPKHTFDSDIGNDEEVSNCNNIIEANVANSENTDDAIEGQYQSNNDDNNITDNNLMVLAEKCNDGPEPAGQPNGGKHQFYCQEITAQPRSFPSTPLNSKLKQKGGHQEASAGFILLSLIILNFD